jgi:hypothetical protein
MIGVLLDCEAVMDIDTDRIDDAVLALLWFHDGARVEVFRLECDGPGAYPKGLIHDPGKAKSVVFTPEGLARSE